MNIQFLNQRLEFNVLDCNILLSNVKLLDQISRQTAAYNDKRYLPWYYALGTQLTPKIVIQIGAKAGLIGTCFLQSCKTVEKWVLLDSYSSIAKSNLKLHGRAEVVFTNKESLPMADLCFLTEKEDNFSKNMDLLWEKLSPEGWLVVDYIHEDTNKYLDFCREKNRESLIFDTRYGVGMIKR